MNLFDPNIDVPMNHSKRVQDIFRDLVTMIPHFDILSPDVLPYGLRHHTRSVCWLAEQVIVQNAQKNKDKLGISRIIDPVSDLGVWDFAMDLEGVKERLYINIKITDASKPRRQNDMSSIKKLLTFLRADPQSHLMYLIFPFNFQGNGVKFNKNVNCGYYSKMSEFVLNIRNQHLQAYYDVAQTNRTNGEFINDLIALAKSRGLIV
jgi:hypothetical protein